MKDSILRLLVSLILSAVAFAFVTLSPAAAQGESIELDTSLREIVIQSDFSGAHLVIFGAVDDSRQDEPDSRYYDIIVVVRGPAETVITRRKEKRAGLWINGESRQFTDVPSFYGVLSTRPINQIADQAVLRRLYIELNPRPFEDRGDRPDEFEEALIRLKTQQGFYVTNPAAINFLSKSLFRTNLHLPTGVAEGEYAVRVYLFKDKQLISWNKSVLMVKKAGLERYLYTLAFDRPYTYGILAVALAVLSGMIGWMVFSRG